MSRFDESSAECVVFTFKEGLLSAVAHDLKIAVQRFQIDVDEDARTVDARFDPASLRVACAMHDGVEAPQTLSGDQRREIEQNIVKHVLKPDANPEIRFVSTSVDEAGDGFRVHGELALNGRRRPLDVAVERRPGRYVATARVHQPDFGIRPYSAMLGTLKVKADVEVRVVVPYPGDAPAARGG
jgi:polyisoprenoid-binding protein YceI